MGQKLEFKSSKSAYLQIDLMFAVLMFLLLIFSALTIFKTKTNFSANKLEMLELDSDSKDICNLLISSPGYPNNWEKNSSSIKFVGLKSNLTQGLNSSKVAALNSSNYLTILDSLNLTGYIKIDIVGLNTSTNYKSFGKSGGYDSFQSKYVCYASYNNEIVKVIVEEWK